MAASKNGHTAIVKVLLKAGADKDAGFNVINRLIQNGTFVMYQFNVAL
jgi:ankyrin repeat protein